MRQLLESRFGPEWAGWVEAAGRFRKRVREADVARTERERCYDRFFDLTVDADTLRARVPTEREMDFWLPPGEAEGARESAAAEDGPETAGQGGTESGDLASGGPPLGLVSLVGAGPGDAGLMTLRGRQRLLAADAVVCDRLALPALPCDLPPTVELHFVGKEPRRHPMPQEEINALLVRLAREGKRVVRLKGGDPYVFGRGGEEAEVLVAAGVPFEVVPCVTAAVAVPGYAGIPVTFREEVVRVTMLTAHESKKEGGPQVRWDLLARDPHAMLLGYMGVTSLPRVVEKLLDGGMDPATPAAMVERGTTSGQRVVLSSLAELPDQVERRGIRPPALFIIGPSVRYADKLDWFSRRPLFGERVVVVAPAGEVGEELELAGAEVVEVPLSVTPSARMVMGALPLTGCVLSNRDQVDALDEERDNAGWSPDVIAWSLDPDAARRARELGWRRVKEVPGSADGAELVAAMLEVRSSLCYPEAQQPLAIPSQK
jgi:uroporphyrin-III C-methyltransferase